MKLSELHRIVNLTYDPSEPHRDEEVVIVIDMPYSTVGGQPTVPVKTAYSGFDWDHGKFMLYPESKLTNADRDFKKQFSDLQEKCGWLEYEKRDLNAQIKRLKKKLEQAEQNGKSD